MSMKVAIAQIGARRHYLVPRALHLAGMLERFYTDICRTSRWANIAGKVPRPLQPGIVRRLIDRMPLGIEPSRITTFSRFALEYKWRCRRALGPSDLTATWLWGGRRFCELILLDGLRSADTVYAFNSAGLELLRAARDRGQTTILDQTIAPRYVERRILEEEYASWPGWEAKPQEDKYLDEYCEREQQEWQAADLILCGSEFVKEGIAACGGPVERCAVVPFGADTAFSAQARPSHDGPLRILTVGSVCLRKGAPYVLEAARQTKGIATYRMVGPIGVTAQAEAELRQHVELTGAVPRSQIIEHYRWADVFLLPSLCEGSANAIYEALATGLPVICTPNAGSVVRDGIDGYIVPARSARAICERIELLGQDPSTRRALSHNAAVAVQADSNGYSRRLVETIIRGTEARDPSQQRVSITCTN
jgi:glycosyltransferase involved in cell wall biosynthesis